MGRLVPPHALLHSLNGSVKNILHVGNSVFSGCLLFPSYPTFKAKAARGRRKGEGGGEGGRGGGGGGREGLGGGESFGNRSAIHPLGSALTEGENKSLEAFSSLPQPWPGDTGSGLSGRLVPGLAAGGLHPPWPDGLESSSAALPFSPSAALSRCGGGGGRGGGMSASTAIFWGFAKLTR